jgi:hypothetical protein
MNHVSPPAGHEPSDVEPCLVGALAAGVALFLLTTPLVLALAYPEAHRMPATPGTLPQPAGPRLETSPKADADRLRAAERERLEHFGWIDRANGVVRIPVARAMQLLAERGIPGWPAPR